MSYPALTNFLRPQINRVTDDEWQQFLACWTIQKTIHRHGFLFAPERTGKDIFFVEKGAFRIIYPTDEQELVVGFGYPNTLLADFPSMIANRPSGFLIQATKRSQLIGIAAHDFFRFVDTSPPFAQFWRQTLEYALLGRIDREIDLLNSSPIERYQRLMTRSPHVFQHIALRHIAAYLRMTPETLSRLRKP